MVSLMNLLEKADRVKDLLEDTGGVVVAFSGGVDSSLLAFLARQALGVRAVAVTADSSTLPGGELEAARQVAREIGIRHVVIDYDELSEDGFAENTPLRCYYCKRGLFQRLKMVACEHGISAVVDGTNVSELKGHRPGYQAALEAGVLMPFVECGVTKEEIRELSRYFGLSTFDKPQMACLSSRFPYGQRITLEALRRVDCAEAYLRGFGLRQLRVRDHGGLARIEVEPEQFNLILDNKAEIIGFLKQLGFRYVSLDLQGFRSGSMDE
jgi:uncharacterized protein